MASHSEIQASVVLDEEIHETDHLHVAGPWPQWFSGGTAPPRPAQT